MRNECRCPLSIAVVGLAKFFSHLLLLPEREPRVHHDENREHDESDDRWPLEEETEHNDDESHVLRMADLGIRASSCNGVLLLRLEEHVPRCREEDEARDDENVAEDVQRTEVRVDVQSQHRLPEMPGIMGIGIEAGVA